MNAVKVHHLDAGTMRPRGLKMNDTNHLVAHVLAVELENGDVLVVDTGVGRDARKSPGKVLGPIFNIGFRPDLEESRSLIAQLEKLGIADRVRHIVLTHLDTDHAGGLPDFPDATIHVHARELDAASSQRGWNRRIRYRPLLWEHGAKFAPFDDGGDEWNGFSRARPVIPELTDQVVIVPLPGHTVGHVAVAVRENDGWLVHAGDSYFHGSTIDPTRDDTRWGSLFFESFMAADRRLVHENHERLAELATRRDEDFTIFSAHDPVEFEALAGRQAGDAS